MLKEHDSFLLMSSETSFLHHNLTLLKRKQTHNYRQDFRNAVTYSSFFSEGVIGVRLEKGNYPTLSAFFAQMATD